MHRSLCLCLVALLVSCSSATTKIDRIEAVSEVDKDYQTILVFVVTSNDSIRSEVETHLVNKLNKEGFEAQAFNPSNDGFPWTDPVAVQSLVSSAAKAGSFEGVLVSSLVKKKKELDYMPDQIVYNPVTVQIGPLASTTYMQEMRVPGYFQESLNYILKSTLFDTSSSQPVWQAFSSTLNPKSLDSAAKDYGSTIVKALRETLPKGDK